MVSDQKFDELVNSTTKYLQDLMNRVAALEADLAKSKKGKTKNDD